MNDQVTLHHAARRKPALGAAGAQLNGVSTGLRGSSPRSNGAIGTLSTPTMRTISSTISALPWMRCARRGSRSSPPAAAGHHEAEMVRMCRISTSGTSMRRAA